MEEMTQQPVVTITQPLLLRINVWAGKIDSMNEVSNAKLENTNEVIVQCPTCSNKYIYDISNGRVIQREYPTCTCGIKWSEMITIFPLNKPRSFPFVRIKNEPDLDMSYIEDENKQKKWWDLQGGTEEYKDVHHTNDSPQEQLGIVRT